MFYVSDTQRFGYEYTHTSHINRQQQVTWHCVGDRIAAQCLRGPPKINFGQTAHPRAVELPDVFYFKISFTKL